MMKRLMLAGTAALTVAFGTACGSDDDDPVMPLMETLELSLDGFEPLMNGFHYEGWAIVGGAPVTTGKFNVDAGGGLVTTAGATIAGGAFTTGVDLTAATDIVITVEPSGDTDAVPSATHIVAGTVAGQSAALSVGHMAALGDGFAGAAGSYILATPTNGGETDENSGIWFLSLASGAPAVGLTLPTLPAGWKYEGWAVTGGMPVTSGTFTAVDVVDDSDPFSGTLAGPPFPGEDYLVNAPAGLTFPTDLSGGTAVISIEPDPDDASTPFTLKPLVATIPTDAVDHTTYELGANLGSLPSGSATIR
jgi:hypothetical protein